MQTSMAAGPRQSLHIACFAVAALVSAGCPFDVADVKQQPTQLDAIAASQTPYLLAADTPIKGAPCGYSRSLRQGTRWFAVGTVPQGTVYRSKDQSLTLECSNVFEAYLVLSDRKLVGFYLPVEKTFSPLPRPIGLPLAADVPPSEGEPR